ncbi:MAG: dihydrofolate reductase family protein [Dehalococcoidia bacterium]|nr:dihydrofolate reductase family protein [Dehalococcoidia bacterium]
MATLPGYAQLTFPDAPEGRPYVLVNMVMSGDGKIVIEGTEQGLGSSSDQALMGQLRSHADAVLNGAETLRKSGSSPLPASEEMRALREYRGLPRAPLGVVLSRSGDLPLDGEFFTSPAFESVVFLADSAHDDRRRAVEATGRRVVSVPVGDSVRAMLRALRVDFGVRVLLCEGGAALNGALFDADAVDEYFVTVGARIVGGDVALTPVRGDRAPSSALVRPLTLVSAVTNPETSEVYLRYRVGTTQGRTSS